MKFVKNILLVLVAALSTVFLAYGGYTIYAQSSYGFDTVSDFEDLRDLYHNTMNDLFNNKIDHLVELIEEEGDDVFDHEDFDSEECSEKSVSTYCVAIQALDIYIEYISDLNIVKGSLPTVDVETPTATDIIGEISVRDDDIEDEAENARIVMEAAIAAYNEFKMAYPMHIKYKSIIENLTKYKIALGKITDETEEFPLRFVDATSTTCE